MKQPSQKKITNMHTKFKTIATVTIITFLVTMLIIGITKRELFFNNYNFTVGEVTYITPPGWKSSGDYSIIYKYNVKGEERNGSQNKDYCGHLSMSYLKVLLIGKKLPVAYSVNDPSTSSILLTQDNADRFHYVLPDSVRYYDSVLTCIK